PLTKPGEKITATTYDWDTTALPEGPYRVLIEASDELANPPDRALKHSLESSTLLVDNTPPVFKALAMNGRRVTGSVVDGLGPIARLEVSLAGTDEWRPINPKDGIFDQPTEDFDADVSALVPPGSHIVAVRAYDTAGNSVTRDVEAK
ncbi:MAG TPA: Ig-like domain-containing protein, partial [Byssovorax sp.]